MGSLSGEATVPFSFQPPPHPPPPLYKSTGGTIAVPPGVGVGGGIGGTVGASKLLTLLHAE